MAASNTDERNRLSTGTVFDLGVLLCLAAWFRALGLQSSRFIGDDQWVIAASNTENGFIELIRFGHTNPGFHVLVRLFSGGQPAGTSAAFIAPAFIAGVLGTLVAYAVILRLSANRFIAFVFGALFALSEAHAVYSVRVKTYTIVVLLAFLFLGYLVSWERRPLLSRIAVPAWARFAVGLVLYFVALTFGLWIGVYAVAALIAVYVLDDDPTVRRWVRRCAAAVVPLSGAWYLFVTSNYSTEAFKAQFSGSGFLIPDEGLLQRPQRTVSHFVRTTRVLGPDVSTAISAMIGISIVVAVIYAIVRRDRVATFASALVALAAAGAGFMGLLPYGTVVGWERLDLWLMPAYMVLLAALVTDAVRWLDLPSRMSDRAYISAAGTLAGAVVLALLLISDRPVPPGSAASAEFMRAVEQEYRQSTHLLYPNTRVLLAIDAYSDVIPVELVADDSSRGSGAAAADASVVGHRQVPSLDEFPDARIVVPITRSHREGELEAAQAALRDAGYVQVDEAAFGRWDRYSIWEAGPAPQG